MGTLIKRVYILKDVPKKGNKTYVNVHLMEGYNTGSVTDALRNSKILQKAFPMAGRKDILISRVRNSHSFHGFSIYYWGGYINLEDIPKDWELFPNSLRHYTF